MEIRTLKAEEIEVRVQQLINANGKYYTILLLYQDARAAMKILDESFGVYGWQRGHQTIDGKMFCNIQIRNPETGEWVTKQDIGVESNTEAEKGQASDAFKRAAVNVGVGRELYSAPNIFINVPDEWVDKPQGKKERLKSKIAFRVSNIEYDGERNITKLSVADHTGKTVYTMAADTPNPKPGSIPETYKCMRCEQLIKDHKGNNGITLASEIAKRSLATYGTQMCYSCSLVKKKTNEANGS